MLFSQYINFGKLDLKHKKGRLFSKVKKYILLFQPGYFTRSLLQKTKTYKFKMKNNIHFEWRKKTKINMETLN